MHYRRFKVHGDANYTGKHAHQSHGLHRTRIYTIWANIRQRTTNPNHRSYAAYGGRGIKMCEGWWNSFKNFYDEVGERPSKLHSLDRIDNDKGYTCGKCKECLSNSWSFNLRWATRSIQQLNQRHRKNETGYRGVRKGNGRFIARLFYNRTYIYIGRYDTAEEAALAYNQKSLEIHGENANLNVLK